MPSLRRDTPKIDPSLDQAKAGRRSFTTAIVSYQGSAADPLKVGVKDTSGYFRVGVKDPSGYLGYHMRPKRVLLFDPFGPFWVQKGQK